MKLIDTFIHRWLRVPYTLHAEITHPKAKKTVVFIHGIGNSSKAWKPVIKRMPPNVRTISVDLLGFGDSAAPAWATYNARTQARSVYATLLKTGIRGRVTVVGHSMGSLVAVELARIYPFFVKQLVLCSPPFYQPDDTKLFALAPDRVLRKIYHAVIQNKNTFLGLATVAMKYKLVSPAFSVTQENIDTYMATLKTMIINQTALHDAAGLKQPIVIFRGALDALVVARNINNLKRKRENIVAQTVVAGHEVMGIYAQTVASKIVDMVDNKSALKP